jgi:uncharacterized membrane protein YeaQ/YmgE (transglycosylase-associated protein family)
MAFFIARIVPLGRTRPWLAELAAAVVAAMLLGVLATALDFGGWDEPDWRAGIFTFCGSVAAVGIVRALQSRQP